MQHKELTYTILSCAFEVHNYFGNGFQELIYQRALAIEMEEKGLSFIREHSLDIEYKGTLIGTRRVDFLVEDCVMLELKAVIQLDNAHLNQAINYCEVYGLEIGLLINFGSPSLEYKRVHNNDMQYKKGRGP
jgi:GxxExxY protein